MQIQICIIPVNAHDSQLTFKLFFFLKCWLQNQQKSVGSPLTVHLKQASAMLKMETRKQTL